MSQNFNLPAGTNEVLSTVVVTQLPEALQALQSLFSGSVEPTTPVAFMLWMDTSGIGVLNIRNAGNTLWIPVAQAAIAWQLKAVAAELTLPTSGSVGDVSATGNKTLLSMPVTGNILAVNILSATATTSTSGNEWDFMLRNTTDSLDLFSSTPGTFTSVGGVGGGVELSATVPLVLVPDQNFLLGAGDVLELQVTKTGSPTSPITRVHATLEYDLLGE